MANSAHRGFFRTAFDAMIAARSKQASRYVDGALLMLDDKTLRSYGVSRAEIAKRRYITSI